MHLFFFLLQWDQKQGFDRDRIINKGELTEVKGVISNELTISRGKSGSSLSIKLYNYPGIKFQITEKLFNSFSGNSFINDIKKGDSLFIKILTYDYETTIAKSKKRRFSEWLFNGNRMLPYEIKAKNNYYLTLLDTNNSWKEEKEFGKFMIYYLSGIIGFIGIIYTILKWTGTTKLIKRWWKELNANR